MPSWVSSLLTQGVALAVLVALFVISVIESHVRDLVWGRLVGSVVAAATQRSRKVEQQATAAVERDARIRSAMATIRNGLVTWSTRYAMTYPEAAARMADIHRGIAELRTEEPRAKVELDAIMNSIPDSGTDVRPPVAQALLDALEAKLRDVSR
jgi:hypothetical protein